jgi:hypothetical protein
MSNFIQGPPSSGRSRFPYVLKITFVLCADAALAQGNTPFKFSALERDECSNVIIGVCVKRIALEYVPLEFFCFVKVSKKNKTGRDLYQVVCIIWIQVKSFSQIKFSHLILGFIYIDAAQNQRGYIYSFAHPDQTPS